MKDIITIMLLTSIALSAFAAEIPEEFRIKREQVFEFTEKPVITRKGDAVTIQFEVKGFSDCAVAVENSNGKILHHLACGVLGKNAPAPFQKNSKKQTIVWDGKDDQDRYVDDRENTVIRVSLGLKPRFERTLFWSPKKRVTTWGQGKKTRLVCAAPEGVYVYDSSVFDYVRLFDHKGEYLRTVYPFPADRIDNVIGLRKHTFPHDGKTLPLKAGFYQGSLLHPKDMPLRVKRSVNGLNSYTMAVGSGYIALTGKRLCRMGNDGTTRGLSLIGPDTELNINIKAGSNPRWGQRSVKPWSSAFSPDGKYLYLTGYMWRYYGNWDGLHGVYRMVFKENSKPVLFAGNKDPKKGGTENGRFRYATSVACDSKGRVYVSDYMNNRIQVFSPEGKHLKNIPSFRPAQITVDPKTGKLYVFSWVVYNRLLHKKENKQKIPAVLTVYAPFDNPKKTASYNLPLPTYDPNRPPPEWQGEYTGNPGVVFCAAVDFWADPFTVWIARPNLGRRAHQTWERTGILLLQPEKGKLKTIKDFGKEVVKSVVRATPPMLDRQRLYVNPKTGNLYVGESDAGVGKSFKQAVKIDPDTGKIKIVDLPFDCEDMCFDINGFIYMRTGKEVARYDPVTWREVPWDYGEERKGVGFCSSGGGKSALLISALPTPGHRSHSFWHMGGLSISVKGHLVVPTCNGANPGIGKSSKRSKQGFKYAGKKYVPKLYPGRYRWGEIHIFDKHGKVLAMDVFQGIGHMNGIGIDKDDNIYVMASAYRLLNGKKYDPGLPDDLSDTLIKVSPNKAKVLSKSKRIPIPLSPEVYPKRPADLHGGQAAAGTAWVEGAEWFYGGIGFAGKNAPWDGGGCCCWNARFCLDYFSRSFVPELRHFSVAVLDTNGNLILRIGRYGNVDDGVPLIPESGIRNPKSIGGDEVALFHGAYLASHTDKRLFIADPGNTRILCVKLGYHTEEKIRLSK